METKVTWDFGRIPYARLHNLKGDETKGMSERGMKLLVKDFMERNNCKVCETRDENFKLIRTYTWEEVKDAD